MKKLFFLVAFATTTMAIMATNPVITSMPSLTISPDAHASGMGDIGAATRPDMTSQHWNAAKYAFMGDVMDSRGGFVASYTPWLRELVGDIDLAYLCGFYRFDDLQAISASFTYFSMGKVQLTDFNGMQYAEAHPNEWALDVAYSRKLHEYVSMAATLRFMYSDLNNGVNLSSMTSVNAEMYPAWTMAADISLYYRQPIDIPMGESQFALGFTLSNLGGKMSYDKGNTSNFIPANMRLGVSYELPFDDYNRLMMSVECNKMLVPTFQSKYASNTETQTYTNEEFSKVSSPKGWWQSFADAPGYYYTDSKTGNQKLVNGTKEEFQEVVWGAGLEYSYDRKFFARAGYSHENYYKGNRRYVTLGAGFALSIVRLDVSYCIAVAASNPLNNTMRFTLGFDLAGIKDLVNNEK
ncbi:MAG: type IX secretion system outer membrane channel protein PorV [Paludibacteraceae bacterium]|nr:type IX secretion system outer membrane channel protein PorV [Paludibacteraceae bacterium]